MTQFCINYDCMTQETFCTCWTVSLIQNINLAFDITQLLNFVSGFKRTIASHLCFSSPLQLLKLLCNHLLLLLLVSILNSSDIIVITDCLLINVGRG